MSKHLVHLEQNAQRNLKLNCYIRVGLHRAAFQTSPSSQWWKKHLKFTTVILNTDFKWWQPNTQAHGSQFVKWKSHPHEFQNWGEVQKLKELVSPHRAMRMSTANHNCLRACALHFKRSLIRNAVSSKNWHFDLEPNSFPNRVMPDKTPLQKICNVCIA